MITKFFDIIIFRYQNEFGFTMPNRKILVSDIRVRGVGQTEVTEESELAVSNEAPVAEKVINFIYLFRVYYVF